MDELIEKYRMLGISLNPPATAEQLQSLEAALDFTLPDGLRLLYEDHNGEDKAGTQGLYLPLRSMPVDEVIDTHGFVKEFGWASQGLRLFWSDDNSNYAGLYVAGPMEGRVCFINHEEQDLSPVYRSLLSFLDTLLVGIEAEADWYEFPRDYPALEPLTPEDAAADWTAAQMLRPLFEAAEDDQKRINYAHCIMALTPPAHTDTLTAYTVDADFYIQERACEILGKRKYEPAIGRLAEVAAMTIPNAPLLARQALAEIGTPEALSRLQEVERGG